MQQVPTFNATGASGPCIPNTHSQASLGHHRLVCVRVCEREGAYRQIESVAYDRWRYLLCPEQEKSPPSCVSLAEGRGNNEHHLSISASTFRNIPAKPQPLPERSVTLPITYLFSLMTTIKPVLTAADQKGVPRCLQTKWFTMHVDPHPTFQGAVPRCGRKQLATTDECNHVRLNDNHPKLSSKSEIAR